jgi:cobalt-zinc-cadmium efflux system protein
MSHAHPHTHRHDEHHDHAHDHAHGVLRFGGGHRHHHAPASFDRAFAIGVSLNLGFVLAEALFGLRAHSLALLADAGHNLSDVLGLGLAWAGSVLARRGPTPRFTYGLRRFSILAAIANAGLLLIAVGAIAIEAIQRLRAPAPVESGIVMWVAAVGIAINVGTALGFLRGRETDLNIRGAFLHMMADAVASAGVVITGFLLAVTGWLWLDPAVSLLLVALITWSTWGLAKDSLDLALDAVPAGIDFDAVSTLLRGLDGVVEVHDLHIWGMSTTETALTAHLVRAAGADDALLTGAAAALHDRFGIEHCTIQIEQGRPEYPCRFCPAPLRHAEAVP